MVQFTESILEEAMLEYLASLGWRVLFSPAIASGEPVDELLPRLIMGDLRKKPEKNK